MQNFRFKFHLLCDLRFCSSGANSTDALGCMRVLRSNISPSSPLLIQTQTTAKERRVSLSVTLSCGHLRREMMRNGQPSETTDPVAQSSWGRADKRNYNSVKETGLKGEAQLSHSYFSDVFGHSAEPFPAQRHYTGKQYPNPPKLKRLKNAQICPCCNIRLTQLA